MGHPQTSSVMSIEGRSEERQGFTLGARVQVDASLAPRHHTAVELAKVTAPDDRRTQCAPS